MVAETVFSGISALPLQAFLSAMLPIHLGIGLVEGLVTTAVVSFVWKARPEILNASATGSSLANISLKNVVVGLGLAALVSGGSLSWFASSSPDGLEWSMAKTSGKEELATPETGIYRLLAAIQQKTAILPDYGFKNSSTAQVEEAEPTASSWPVVDSGTSTAGLVGGSLTLILALVIGFLLRKRSQTR